MNDKTKTNNVLVAGLNESAYVIFQNAKDKGFWDKERNVGELLMLVTSELNFVTAYEFDEDALDMEVVTE